MNLWKVCAAFCNPKVMDGNSNNLKDVMIAVFGMSCSETRICWSAIIVAAVWIYGILLSLPPMFGWGQYGNDILNITCILLWDDHDSERSNIYIAFILLVGHGLPTVIIISISVHIILTDSRRRQNLRITKMVKLTVMIYLVAWIPRVTLGIAIHYFDVEPSPIIVILTYTLSTLTICNKPIIAIYLNNQLKNCVRKMFGREVSDEAGIGNEIGMVSERNN
nr:pinopsin-like [Megalopta genalis]XP_033335799.1 pinopsin-like [Megalopta genalis]